MNRRDVLQAGTAIAALASAGGRTMQAQSATSFSIDAAFAGFVADIGLAPDGAGGQVVFTGRDPILRSPFRLGACMAIPAFVLCPGRLAASSRGAL
jgi:hypothetical protein